MMVQSTRATFSMDSYMVTVNLLGVIAQKITIRSMKAIGVREKSKAVAR